ncbi:LysR family transcriptional regulator [Azospirillum canadense]|uniref:LysR family transcriptional regulator n=1 Tax=Azospirillum canadense TaxID=403962 RepID=UPI0022274C99|nr:LysR family transcriptional regulator [Azospirillum canadense]MCW2240040.1 DNA-binding transcriptional LysR family regulator [Azospirillum canadense]
MTLALTPVIPQDGRLERAPLRLKLRQLRLVVAIADLGSLRRAADHLNTTQPAATKLLQQAEMLLGVPLFERQARGLTPTPYGAVVIRRARNLMAELAAAGEEIAGLASGLLGAVRIGCVTGAMPQLMTGTVRELRERFPTLCLSLQVDTSDRLVAALHDRRIDLAVGRIPAGADRGGLLFETLCDEPLALVCRVGHPLLGSGALRIEDAVAYPWVMHPRGSPSRDRLEDHFHQLGIAEPTLYVETASDTAALSLVAAEDVLAVLPLDTVATAVRGGTVAVLPFALGFGLSSLGIIRVAGCEQAPATTAVLDALRRQAAALPDLRRSWRAGP